MSNYENYFEDPSFIENPFSTLPSESRTSKARTEATNDITNNKENKIINNNNNNINKPIIEKKASMSNISIIPKKYNRENFCCATHCAFTANKDQLPIITITDALKTTDMSGSSFTVYVIRTSEAKNNSTLLDVRRRYSEFATLRNLLRQYYPTLIVPPIPEKHSLTDYAIKQGKAKDDPRIIEKRKRMLQVFLNRLAKHPVFSSLHIFHVFLEPGNWLENENKVKKVEIPIEITSYDISEELQYMEIIKSTKLFMKCIVHLSKIHQSTIDSYQILSQSYSTLGASYNGWSLHEIIFSQILETIGQSSDSNRLAICRMISLLEISVSESLHEYKNFSNIILKILAWYKNNYKQYKYINDSLTKKKLKLSYLESIENDIIQQQQLQQQQQSQDSTNKIITLPNESLDHGTSSSNATAIINNDGTDSRNHHPYYDVDDEDEDDEDHHSNIKNNNRYNQHHHNDSNYSHYDDDPKLSQNPFRLGNSSDEEYTNNYNDDINTRKPLINNDQYLINSHSLYLESSTDSLMVSNRVKSLQQHHSTSSFGGADHDDDLEEEEAMKAGTHETSASVSYNSNSHHISIANPLNINIENTASLSLNKSSQASISTTTLAATPTLSTSIIASPPSPATLATTSTTITNNINHANGGDNKNSNGGNGNGKIYEGNDTNIQSNMINSNENKAKTEETIINEHINTTHNFNTDATNATSTAATTTTTTTTSGKNSGILRRINSFIDNDPDLTRRNNIIKIRGSIQNLQGLKETLYRELIRSGKEIQYDLEYFQKEKHNDIKKIFINYAKIQREYNEQMLKVWEETKMEIKKITL